MDKEYMGLTERTNKLLTLGENLNVEYKVKVTQDFNEDLVAFANASGGICLFGVRDIRGQGGKHQGQVVGIEVSDKTRGQLQSRADNTIDKIPIRIEHEYTDDRKSIYIVSVPEGSNKPYCTGGGRYLVRRDGQNCPVSPDMMASLIEHRISTTPSSQPIVQLVPHDISIAPHIPLEGGSATVILQREQRFAIVVGVEVLNVSNFTAQDLLIDGDVSFKVRRPRGNRHLPVHLPEYRDFLPPLSSGLKAAKGRAKVRFDNFVAQEVLLDFSEGRANWPGFPFLPTHEEMEDRNCWPSPRLVLKCLYSDAFGQHYISQVQRFFHLWEDSKAGRLGIDLVTMGGADFLGVKKVSYTYRQDYIRAMRSLRYTAFDGNQYAEGTLLLLRASERDDDAGEPNTAAPRGIGEDSHL